MMNDDLALLDKARRLAGGITQQTLAEKLGIQPTAVSNWVRQGRIPLQSRAKLLDLIERLESGGFFDSEDESSGRAAVANRPPDRLRADAERCGFWAQSAWCFNYLHVPDGRKRKATDDEVWRTWNHLSALHTSTFRHYFRYQPFGEKTAEADCKGFGFLRDWKPTSIDRTLVDGTVVEYLGAHASLSRETVGHGGYYVHARESVLCWAQDHAKYEFVAFRPECPVTSANLILSVPRELRGRGPMVAYLLSTDYPQYYDFASRIGGNRGELDRLIEPWGRQLSVCRLMPEQITMGKHVPRNHVPWDNGWPAEDSMVIQEIIKRFVTDQRESLSRDVYVVSADYPPPLMTLLMFWPLPERS